MRPKLIISVFCFFCFGAIQSQETFDKTLFYKIMAANNLNELETEFLKLKNSGKINTKAYQGALQMKKAGLLKDPSAKLNNFKSGHKELESSITNDTTNAEYRFLRLMIQENSPKIMNYQRDLQKDASYLRKHYKQLDPVVRQAVLNYCKTSKILKTEDLNNTHD